MKAVRYHEHGDAGVLSYEDAELPSLGPDEVRIRVAACGVNDVDVDLRAGVSPWERPLPHQLGVELAGEIDAIGLGVERLAVGDRVWSQHQVECGRCRFCRDGRPGRCPDAKMFSSRYAGGYAEYVAAPAHATHRLPDCLSYDQAAAGQVVFTTAWHMLLVHGRLAAGDTVVIQAAGSATGRAAVQVAMLFGACVIATDCRSEALATARALGVETIDAASESIPERVLELTDGAGADLVVARVGGTPFLDGLRAMRTEGRFVTCGGRASLGTPEETRRTMELMGEGKLVAAVDAAVPLEDACEAHRMVERADSAGKVILVP